MPPEPHATSLIAASVWGSAACPTLVIAASRSWRRSATKASRSRQNFPTPPLHSRSRAAMASASMAWALVTAGVTRDARTSVTSLILVEAKPMPAVTAKTNVTNQATQPTSPAAR